MATLGHLMAYLGVDTKGLDKGLNYAERKVKTSTHNMEARFKSLKRVAMWSFAGWGVAKVANGFLATATSFEQLEVKLDALTKGKGAETLEKINKWALDMPVNTQQAVDSFVKMQAMGLNPTIEKMQILTDTASIFGEETLPRISRALGQMQTLGKLSAEELNQLSESGINARKYLTEAFGMTVEEVQKSGMEIEKVIDAIWEGLNRDFGGAAKRQMTSWQGLTATFKSYIAEIQRSVMAAGVFDLLKEELGEINKGLKGWLENNKDLIKQKVPEYIANIKSAVSGIVSVLSTLINIYNSLPKEVIGAAGAGILGRMLLGATPVGRFITMLLMINQAMANLDKTFSAYDFSVQRAVKDSKEFSHALAMIKSVLKGERDWNTGALKALAPVGDRGSGDFDSVASSFYGESDSDQLGGPSATLTPVNKLKKFGPASKVDTGISEAQQALLDAQAEYEKMRLNAQENFTDAYKQATLSQTDYELYQLQQQYDYYSKYITDKTQLEEWYNAERKNINQQGQQELLSVLNEFNNEYQQATLSQTELELRELQKRYDYYSKYITDKKSLDAWYDAEKSKLTEKQQTQESNMFDGWGNKFANTLNDMLWGSDATFKEILAQWGKMITQMLIQQEMLKFTKYLGGGDGKSGLISKGIDLVAGLFHDGGIAGRASAGRLVPASLFNSAPKFHKGLIPREYPAILEEGEGVLTEDKMRTLNERLKTTRGEQNNTFHITVQAPEGNLSKQSTRQLKRSLVGAMGGI